MPKTKLQQNYNENKFTEKLLQSVSEAYLNPPEGFADKDGHMKINELAVEFSMTWMKIRKLLITAGVYENPRKSIFKNSTTNKGRVKQTVKHNF